MGHHTGVETDNWGSSLRTGCLIFLYFHNRNQNHNFLLPQSKPKAKAKIKKCLTLPYAKSEWIWARKYISGLGYVVVSAYDVIWQADWLNWTPWTAKLNVGLLIPVWWLLRMWWSDNKQVSRVTVLHKGLCSKRGLTDTHKFAYMDACWARKGGGIRASCQS